jgi:hypothetical protein
MDDRGEVLRVVARIKLYFEIVARRQPVVAQVQDLK